MRLSKMNPAALATAALFSVAATSRTNFDTLLAKSAGCSIDARAADEDTGGDKATQILAKPGDGTSEGSQQQVAGSYTPRDQAQAQQGTGTIDTSTKTTGAQEQQQAQAGSTQQLGAGEAKDGDVTLAKGSYVGGDPQAQAA